MEINNQFRNLDYFKDITDILMAEELKDSSPGTTVELNVMYPEHQNNYEYKNDEEKLLCTIDVTIDKPPSYVGSRVFSNKMHYEVTSEILGVLARTFPVIIHHLGHVKCVDMAKRLKAIVHERHQLLTTTSEQRRQGGNQIKMAVKVESKKGFIEMDIRTKYIINGEVKPDRLNLITL